MERQCKTLAFKQFYTDNDRLNDLNSRVLINVFMNNSINLRGGMNTLDVFELFQSEQ